MVRRFVIDVLQAIVDQLAGPDVLDTQQLSNPKAQTAVITHLALRIGRVEGRQSLQLAIETTILGVILSAAVAYFLSAG